MTTRKPRPCGEPTTQERIAAKLRLVHDSLRRINDNLNPFCELSQGQLAYIDEQSARCIAWLASVRALAITQGEIEEPFFDDGDVWGEDDFVTIVVPGGTEQIGGES